MEPPGTYETPKHFWLFFDFVISKGLLVGAPTSPWWGGLSTPVTLRAISAVATLLAGPPLLDRSKGRRQTKRDTKTDAGSSVISSGLKQRANDAREGSSSYSNRRDYSGVNGCCTAMWKANGKTTALSIFLDSLFPKQRCEMLPLETKLSGGKLLPQKDLRGGEYF